MLRGVMQIKRCAIELHQRYDKRYNQPYNKGYNKLRFGKNCLRICALLPLFHLVIVTTAATLVMGVGGVVMSAPLSMEPITPLNVPYRSHTLPQYVMQYQIAELPGIEDVTDFRETLQWYMELRKARNMDVQAVFDRLYTAVGIKYYIDRMGAIGTASLRQYTSLSMGELRSLLGRIAADIRRDATFLGKKSVADRSLFQYFRFTAGSLDSNAIKELQKILADKQAPPALKQRVYYIMLHAGVSSHSNIMNLRVIAQFEQRYYSRARSISLNSSVASTLALAAAYAGVHKGRKIRDQTSNKYLSLLKDASQKLSRLESGVKQRVIRDMVGIWMLAQREPDYARIPFSLASLQESEVYYPLLERQAIAKYDRTKQRSVSKSHSWESVYRKMLSQEELESYHVKFLKRLLDGRFAIYQRSRDFVAFEREIQWQLTRVREAKERDPSYLGHHTLLGKMYRLVVDREWRVASSMKSPERLKLSYIALVDRYIKRLKPGDMDKAELYERQGRIYQALRKYSSAVRMYLAAAELSESEAKIGYMDFAIAAQQQLARWPKAAPWGQKLPKVQRSHADTLAKLYLMKMKEQSSVESHRLVWADVAQLGHVYMAMGRDEQAADLFARSIVASGSDPTAPMGAFMAIGIYERKLLWQKLEDLCQYLRKQKIPARLAKAALSVDQKLALALAEGGKSLFLKKKYNSAVEKFTTFLAMFKNFPQAAEVRYVLAKSYWGKREYLSAIDELQHVSRNHKKFQDYKNMMLLGIEWSQALAVEEAVIFFVEGYTRNYSDKKAYELRHMVAGLYEGTQRYREGLANFLALRVSPHASSANKERYDIRLLRLVGDHGTEAEVIKFSNLLITTSKNSKVRALAYGMQASYYYEQKQLGKLQAIEVSLSKLNHSVSEVREARAQSKLYALRLVDTGELYQEVQNIALADPTGYLKRVFDQFNSFYKQVSAVCQIGPSSVCLAAMNWYKITGEKTIHSLQEVNINPSYDETVKRKFVQTKQSVLSSIERFSQNAHNLAMSSLSRLGSTPQTVLDMLWLQDKDWNFDPITWGQANGYMNWQMKGVYDQPL